MLLALVLVLEYWPKGTSSKELRVKRDSDPGGWIDFISTVIVLVFSYLQHAFASSKKYPHRWVCWSIPPEIGNMKLREQTSQKNCSDFILIRRGGHSNFVSINILDKSPPVWINNKNLTNSDETGFSPQ